MYELGWIQDFIDGGSIYGPSKGVPVGGGGAAGVSSLGIFSVKFRPSETDFRHFEAPSQPKCRRVDCYLL